MSSVAGGQESVRYRFLGTLLLLPYIIYFLIMFEILQSLPIMCRCSGAPCLWGSSSRIPSPAGEGTGPSNSCYPTASSTPE